MREAEMKGEPRAIVALATIGRRYENWDAALVSAGLEPLGVVLVSGAAAMAG